MLPVRHRVAQTDTRITLHTLVSDPEALFSVIDRPLHDLSTSDSRGAAGLHPREGASGVADASLAEGAAIVTSSCEHLDMTDTGR